ncbi:MAG: hypothetical protein ACI8T1_004474 [Verrucomicrobiales bacterium]|jgi:hypothetical protein
MKWRWIIFVSLLMFGGGWMLGKNAPHSSEPRSAAVVNRSPVLDEWLGSSSPEKRLQDLDVALMKALLRDLVTRSAPTQEAIRLREALFQRLAETDPNAFLTLFQDGLAGNAQKALLLQCVETLTASDPRQAAVAIRYLPGGWQQAEAWKAFAQTGAVSDPQATLAEASQAGRFRQSAMKALVDRWGDDDPAAALNAVSGEGFQRDLETWFRVADTKVMAKWLQGDPQAALDWLGNLPISQDFKGNLEYFLGHEMRAHLDSIEAMPEALRERVIASVGKEVYASRLQERDTLAEVSTNPDEAYAKALEAMLERPYDGKRLVNEVLKKVSESSPEKALELASSLPGRSMRHDFFKEYANRESEHDPQGTFDWAKDLEDRATRAGAVEGAIGSWIKEDFAAAIEALATVGEETWSRGFFHTITRAASADTFLGNEANQAAMATLLESMQPEKRTRWVGQLKNNLSDNLPAPLRQFATE